MFAGVSLEGAALQIDDDANAAFYSRKEIRAAEIFAAKGNEAAAVKRLHKMLAEHAAPPKR